MHFTGSIRVLTPIRSRDFKNPYVYPLDFRKVHMQVPYGSVWMPYENTRTTVTTSRVGRAGPMRGPYGAHRTQQTTMPVRAPVRYLHDCLRTFFGMIGSPCMNIVYAQFSGAGYMAPVRVRNLQRIAQVRTACHAITHGFSGFWLLRDL